MTRRKHARLDVLVGVTTSVLLVLATQFGWLGRYGASGQVEVAAVVLYAASVWLATRNSILTWPSGIAATALYLWLFYDWELYADAGLQVVFIGFSVFGFWAWWQRGEADEEERIEHAPARTLVLVAAAIAVGTAVVREYLIAVSGAAPFWDAFLTTGSLGALYLLIRRYAETWILWGVLDVAYVVLFVSRELYLSAALYAALFAMVVVAAPRWFALARRPGRLVEAPA